MRLAVISDIHGNLEALREVMRDMEGHGVNSVVCLGDNVGYGPEPEGVIRLIREQGIPSVLGNHELGLMDPGFLDWFNVPTRESLVRTRNLVSPETMDYVSKLPPFLTACDARFVHGCPPRSVTTYLFELSAGDLSRLLSSLPEDLCFVGHTHDLRIVEFDGSTVRRGALSRGEMPLAQDRRYIVNVGSVGQPRDGNNNAKYVIWDPDGLRLDVRFVPYDIASTARKIIERGFPEFHATRLW
jgi:predicted phosphodiesterase